VLKELAKYGDAEDVKDLGSWRWLKMLKMFRGLEGNEYV
jgi:hypothetical protein